VLEHEIVGALAVAVMGEHPVRIGWHRAHAAAQLELSAGEVAITHPERADVVAA
jgi:hypothetical protein